MHMFAKISSVTAFLIGFGVAASAATIDGTECSISDVDHSSACGGLQAISGPPFGEASLDDINSFFGGGFMSASGLDIDIGSSSGEYTIDDPMVGYDYAITMKGAASGGTSYFAAYLLAASDIFDALVGGDLTGDFNMNAFTKLTGGGSAPGLSNAQLWKRESDDVCDGFPFCDDVSLVPVPAGLPLLLTGFGVVGILARRRRKVSA